MCNATIDSSKSEGRVLSHNHLFFVYTDSLHECIHMSEFFCYTAVVWVFFVWMVAYHSVANEGSLLYKPKHSLSISLCWNSSCGVYVRGVLS